MKEHNSIVTTQETPLPVSSASFETRKVQIVDEQTLRIKPTLRSLAFSLLFILLGLGLAGFWAASTFSTFDGPGSIPLLLIGVLFAATGFWSYRSGNEQVLIHHDTGAAFIRSWRPTMPLDTAALFKHIKAQDITAIQMISHDVKFRSNRSKRSNSYTEYQVNLCTADGERHNVFITLKSDNSETLGKVLASLFNVPLRVHKPDSA